MTLRNIIDLKAASMVNWTSPPSPVGTDHYEIYVGMQPLHSEKPPSLKNPIYTKIPTAQDGWQKNSSRADRAKAISDLVELHSRMRRQTGKPEISRQAQVPSFPFDAYRPM